MVLGAGIMERAILLAIVAALPLAGCVSDDDFAGDAVARARTECEAQGKQYILKNAQVASGELMDRSVDVEGACVGPGEPGYKPAKG
jgi:hypothetical protein